MLVIQNILLCYGIDILEYLKSIIDRYLCNCETSDSEEDKIIEIISQQSCACTLDENGLKFWPPLYVQRYMAVQEVIEHPIWNGSIKKVVDFGCSEMGLFKFIKPILGLNNIILVDVDYDTLNRNQFKVLPINHDYISMHERKEPLTVDIYNGSIADKDDRMLGVDAVICIELIEHLYLDVLDSLPNNVFEFIKPKLAVFTTPNVEFNILFTNFTTQFRHDDHKFEWTRKQFKEWAKKITTHYPEYAVQFDGIGAGPTGTENIGCCSQMAIFYRKDMTTSPVKPINSTPYKLLRRVNYPYEHDVKENYWELPVYKKLTEFVSESSRNNKYIVGHNMEIPLKDILLYLSDSCSSMDKLVDIVKLFYHTKKNDHGEWLLVKTLSGFSSDEYESDSNSFSSNSGQEYNLLENTVNLDNDTEDWNTSAVLSIDKSKLCYSTPMTRDPEIKYYSNNVDSFSTVHSNSGLYKTAVDYNKTEDTDDMVMSSSCNSSIVEDCNVYQDFKTEQNNSVINKDVNEIENTLTCVANSRKFPNDGDKLNHNYTDTEISSSNNGSVIVEDCIVYQDFESGRNNSVINEEDVNEAENTLTYVANSRKFPNDSDKLNHNYTDTEISSSNNGSVIVEDCIVYQDFKSGRNNSVKNEEDINETENTLICGTNSHEFSNNEKLNDNIINDNTIIKNNSNMSLKLKCSSDTVHQLKSNNPDEICITNCDGVNEIDDQLTVCLHRSLLDENGYTEKLLSTSDNELSKK